MTPRQARQIAGAIASRNRRTASGSCASASRASASRWAGSAFDAAPAPPFARIISRKNGAAYAPLSTRRREVWYGAGALQRAHFSAGVIDPIRRLADFYMDYGDLALIFGDARC